VSKKRIPILEGGFGDWNGYSENDEDGSGEDDSERLVDDGPADLKIELSGEATGNHASFLDKAARKSSEPFSRMQEWQEIFRSKFSIENPPSHVSPTDELTMRSAAQKPSTGGFCTGLGAVEYAKIGLLRSQIMWKGPGFARGGELYIRMRKIQSNNGKGYWIRGRIASSV